MCLGIPMRVTHINGYTATCEARGAVREASLLMMAEGEVEVGDIVMISVGNVLQKMTEEDAQQAWALYDEIFEQLDQ